MEQLQGQRGAQQRVVLKGTLAAENAVGPEQQQGADAFAAARDELGDVEVERLEEIAVGVALGVLLEEAGEESSRTAPERAATRRGAGRRASSCVGRRGRRRKHGRC